MATNRITMRDLAGAIVGMFLCAMLILFPTGIGLSLLLDREWTPGAILLSIAVFSTYLLRRFGPTLGS